MAAQRDLYEVLGVEKDADEKTIKKKYRSIAMKCHPDRFPDDKEKEEQFKEATRAMETLTNKKKRANYDQYGFKSLEMGWEPSAADYKVSDEEIAKRADDILSRRNDDDEEEEELVVRRRRNPKPGNFNPTNKKPAARKLVSVSDFAEAIADWSDKNINMVTTLVEKAFENGQAKISLGVEDKTHNGRTYIMGGDILNALSEHMKAQQATERKIAALKDFAHSAKDMITVSEPKIAAAIYKAAASPKP